MGAIGNDGVDKATNVVITKVARIEIALIVSCPDIDDTESGRCPDSYPSVKHCQALHFPDRPFMHFAVNDADEWSIDSTYP